MRLRLALKGSLLTYLKENKKARIGIVLFGVGIFLILIASFGGGGNTEDIRTDSLEEYRIRLEEQLSSLCCEVEGVGRAEVYVTLECGERLTYKGSTLIETRPPTVLGVSVVCEGGASERVRKELTDMITALFNIGSNRVSVLKLNS